MISLVDLIALIIVCSAILLGTLVGLTSGFLRGFLLARYGETDQPKLQRNLRLLQGGPDERDRKG